MLVRTTGVGKLLWVVSTTLKWLRLLACVCEPRSRQMEILMKIPMSTFHANMVYLQVFNYYFRH
jgi:hypothetical protein